MVADHWFMQVEKVFKIIFVPIVEHYFGYFVVNGWLNEYFVKDCIEFVTVYGLAPK